MAKYEIDEQTKQMGQEYPDISQIEALGNSPTVEQYLRACEEVAKYRTGRFFKVKREHFPILSKCGKSVWLYMYMVTWITTDRNARGFWKSEILPYFLDGYMPFCQNYTYIARSFDVDCSRITKWVKTLQDMNLIQYLGEKTIKPEHKQSAKIWSVGHWYSLKHHEGEERIFVPSIDKLVHG